MQCLRKDVAANIYHPKEIRSGGGLLQELEHTVRLIPEKPLDAKIRNNRSYITDEAHEGRQRLARD